MGLYECFYSLTLSHVLLLMVQRKYDDNPELCLYSSIRIAMLCRQSTKFLNSRLRRSGIQEKKSEVSDYVDMYTLPSVRCVVTYRIYKSARIGKKFIFTRSNFDKSAKTMSVLITPFEKRSPYQKNLDYFLIINLTARFQNFRIVITLYQYIQ